MGKLKRKEQAQFLPCLKAEVSLLEMIKRTDTGADDTWVGTISGDRPMLLEVDFHYQIDTVGSRQTGIK
jgi:hypothetical protein